MLNHESVARSAALRAGGRLLKPGTALRLALAIVAVFYIAAPTAIQWASFAGQRAEIATNRQEPSPAPNNAEVVWAKPGSPENTGPLVRSAVADVVGVNAPVGGIVEMVRAPVASTAPIAIAGLAALVIAIRRSSDYRPRHAKTGLRGRLLIRRR